MWTPAGVASLLRGIAERADASGAPSCLPNSRLNQRVFDTLVAERYRETCLVVCSLFCR